MKLTVTNYSDTKIKNRLKAWLDIANEEQILLGKNWYKEAQEFAKYLSETYKIDSYICASVVSALSPNNKWERNKIDAETVIKAHLNGIAPENIKVCTYNPNKIKAFDILNGKLITEKSPKTHSFAMNVGLLSSDHITVDKWHLRACLLYPNDGILPCVESCTSVQYRRIEKITAQLSKEYNLKGYELQAIIWVTIKDAWNR
jgi:hypothetical protein